MDKNKIICPNCGAENEYGGTCQYCGCALKNVGSHIVQGNEGETRAHFLNDGKYEYFKEEFDNIEKITRTFCGRWITHSAPYLSFSFCREHTSNGEERVYILLKRVPCSQYGQPTTLLFSLNGRCYSVNPTKVEKLVLSKEDIEWEVYYEIDANILNGFCEVPKTEARISFKDLQSLTVSISLQHSARLLYNRLFDNTAYADVIMEIQHKVDEEILTREQRIRKRKEKFQKEREEFKRLREARIRKEEELKRQREENEKRRAEEKAKEETRRKKNKRIKNTAFIVGILLMPLVIINIIHIQNSGLNHDALHKAPIAWWIWWSALFCYIGLSIIYHRFKNKI